MSSKSAQNLIKFEASHPTYNDPKIILRGAANMIEQTALVASVEGGYAWVIPQKSSTSCGKCVSNTNCVSDNLINKNPKNQAKMRVLNPLHARQGDQVVIGVRSEALILYSVLAYLLPLVSLIIFAALGKELFTALHLMPEIGAILCGFVGLIGSLRLINLWSARHITAPDFQPVILRIQGIPEFQAHFMPMASRI
jgi:sigma-E factor negative regulatory protein RseC